MEQKRKIVFDLFENKTQNFSEISRISGVGRETVSRWIKKFKNGESCFRQSKYFISDEEFIKIVQESDCVAECLRKQGLKPCGGNYFTFHQRVKRLNLTTQHFTGSIHSKGKGKSGKKEIPIEQCFVKDGTMSSVSLKRKILKYKLKDYVCEICGIENWLNKPLSLHLDHTNGINTDNRLENLRFLCPNCHSQTDTYCGKSKGSYQ